jgi:hypothetical protein
MSIHKEFVNKLFWDTENIFMMDAGLYSQKISAGIQKPARALT